MRVDLHLHSSLSDGTGTPAQVMAEAAAAGMDVVALTDHDTVSGWDEARESAREHALEWVPGIEVSTRNRGSSVHLLAYWPDPHHPAVIRELQLTRDARIDRAQRIVAKLAADYPITWESVLEHVREDATVGRPHIADALVATGVVPTRDAAFARILIPGSAYYVPHYAPRLADAVETMRAAGGLPVLAHPGATGRGHPLTDREIKHLVDRGLVGIEVDHRDHDSAQRARFAGLCARLGLVRTGSSDYHGTGKPNRIGENLTSPEAFAQLQALRSR